MTDVKPDIASGVGAAALDQVVMNLPVPALRMGQRIEDWEPLFSAAVGTLKARGAEGEKMAISLLPAYVNRRPAECELVKQVVKSETTLSGAFTVLIKTLDPPLDKYECMQSLCRLDWIPGVQVDDFYY